MVNLNLQKILQELECLDHSSLSYHGYDIYISMVKPKKQILLKTQVYYGGNYIPDSVRKSASKKPIFDQSWIYTFTSIDEKKYGVHLNYKGNAAGLNSMKFKQVLEEFCWLADEWRLLLDEDDRNDLVYIYTQ